MSRGHKQGHHEPMEETLAQIAIQQIDQLTAILQNRVQQETLSGTVVAAGTTITPDAVLTAVKTGKVRISATAGLSANAAGTVTPILEVSVNGGVLLQKYNWPVFTAGAAGAVDEIAAVFEFDSGALPGQTVRVHWLTTAGDAAVTVGGAAGAGTNGAALLVEELP